MGTGFRYGGGRGNAKPYTTLNAVLLHGENVRLVSALQEIEKICRAHQLLKQYEPDIDTICELVVQALQPYDY